MNEQLADSSTPEHADAGPRADEALEVAERRRMVIDALAHLDAEKRAVFILHELDEFPMPEVATTLGIPMNTGYSRLRLARVEFREQLERIVARTTRMESALA